MTAALRFFWREDPERRIEVYEYTRQVFGAKSLPTCANYALHQVAKDNAVIDESIVRTVQRKFYVDDFLKSVKTHQEAIESYQNVTVIRIKGGFNLMKWITSDDEVKSQIPETDRPMKVVKTFEAELQSSSILGLSWNVDTDSLVVCRGSEHEIPAKITQRIVLSLVSAVFYPFWDMFNLHHTNTVSTQKHLGSDGTSMGQGVVSRIFKTVQWLVLWIERNKDNVNKSTSFRKIDVQTWDFTFS